jgi:nicotinamide riboside kinase
MNVDLPWVPDDLRDRPHDRSSIFETFKANLVRCNKKFEIISGLGELRLQRAIQAIENYKFNEFN